MLPRTGAGGCCKVANKYPGSFAPSRWFPPALKQRGECEPRGLTHASRRASPMRAASVYQAPAVPYHTTVRGSLSTPDRPLCRDARYYTNRGAENCWFLTVYYRFFSHIVYSASLRLCVKNITLILASTINSLRLCDKNYLTILG